MEYKYGFDKCQSFGEVKERRRRLSVLLHPDKGGDNTLFAAMIAESEQRVEDLSNLFDKHEKSSETEDSKPKNKPAQQLSNIATAILRADDVQQLIANEVRRRMNPQTAQIVSEILSKI